MYPGARKKGKVSETGLVQYKEMSRTAAEGLSGAHNITGGRAFRCIVVVIVVIVIARTILAIRAASALPIDHSTGVSTPGRVRNLPTRYAAPSNMRRTQICNTLHHCSSSHRERNKNFHCSRGNRFGSTRYHSRRSRTCSRLIMGCKTLELDQSRVDCRFRSLVAEQH